MDELDMALLAVGEPGAVERPARLLAVVTDRDRDESKDAAKLLDPDLLGWRSRRAGVGGFRKFDYRGGTMERQVINPWTWQDRFGFVQANKVTGVEHVLYCAGQTSVDQDGTPLHVGQMREQTLQAIDNLQTVLREAGFELEDIVRLTTYVTDVDAYRSAAREVGERLGQAGVRQAASLIGVARLALPELLVEVEATAAR
jgi:enamine deaminase RidA (YjgF/YER057c/UK114 family)